MKAAEGSPVYYARDLWNKLSVDVRELDDITVFKAKIRKEMYAAYVAEEMAKLTAGIFV